MAFLQDPLLEASLTSVDISEREQKRDVSRNADVAENRIWPTQHRYKNAHPVPSRVFEANALFLVVS